MLFSTVKPEPNVFDRPWSRAWINQCNMDTFRHGKFVDVLFRRNIQTEDQKSGRTDWTEKNRLCSEDDQ